MLRFSGSSQNPGSSVLDELQLSNGLLRHILCKKVFILDAINRLTALIFLHFIY